MIKKYDLVLAGNLKKKPGRESVQIHTKKKKKTYALGKAITKCPLSSLILHSLKIFIHYRI